MFIVTRLDHIFTLYSTTQARLSENRDTFVCYVDLKKAFDNVNRVDLWYKLEQLFGLDGKFLKVLKGMYAEVLSCVQVNDNITDWFSVEKGVKQGCILSPMLFSMFINDLAHYINSLGTGIVCGDVRLAILLFADDIALMAESEVELQKLLDGLSAWCFKLNCQINPILRHKLCIFTKSIGPVLPTSSKGDLGWAPMVVYTKCEVVKLWHRLCSLPSTRISSKIFRWLGNLRRKNWVQSTRHLIQNVELPLHAINCTSRKAIGDQAWEAFASHHGLEWKNRVWDPKAVETTSGGRLSLYRVLKPSPGTEPYVAANVQYACSTESDGWVTNGMPTS